MIEIYSDFHFPKPTRGELLNSLARPLHELLRSGLTRLSSFGTGMHVGLAVEENQLLFWRLGFGLGVWHLAASEERSKDGEIIGIDLDFMLPSELTPARTRETSTRSAGLSKGICAAVHFFEPGILRS